MRGVGCILLLALCSALAGCVSHGGGISGTCRYGLRNQQGHSTCYTRPDPSDKDIKDAMSGEPLARGLAAWRRAGGVPRVDSVGVNQWAESTFTAATGEVGPAEDRLASFDSHGKPTKGDAGYASDPGFGSGHGDQVPVRDADPAVFARVVAKIRAGQPDTHMLQAVLNLEHHTGEVGWHIEMLSSKAHSSLMYYAGANGAGLCHEADSVPGDGLKPTAGIPTCAFAPVIFGFDFSDPSKLPTGVTTKAA